jgi:hypothetical protein
MCVLFSLFRLPVGQGFHLNIVYSSVEAKSSLLPLFTHKTEFFLTGEDEDKLGLVQYQTGNRTSLLPICAFTPIYKALLPSTAYIA